MAERKKAVWTSIYIASLIFILEAYALSKGINGVCLTATIAALASIAGFKFRDWFPRLKVGGSDGVEEN